MTPTTVSRSVGLNPEHCHIAIASWTGLALWKTCPSTKLGLIPAQRGQEGSWFWGGGGWPFREVTTSRRKLSEVDRRTYNILHYCSVRTCDHGAGARLEEQLWWEGSGETAGSSKGCPWPLDPCSSQLKLLSGQTPSVPDRAIVGHACWPPSQWPPNVASHTRFHLEQHSPFSFVLCSYQQPKHSLNLLVKIFRRVQVKAVLGA